MKLSKRQSQIAGLIADGKEKGMKASDIMTGRLEAAESVEAACIHNGGTIDIQLTNDAARAFFRLGDDLQIGKSRYVVDKRTEDWATLRIREGQ